MRVDVESCLAAVVLTAGAFVLGVISLPFEIGAGVFLILNIGVSGGRESDFRLIWTIICLCRDEMLREANFTAKN